MAIAGLNKNPICIMQGRLSPRYKGRHQAFPVYHWKEEFYTAKSLGFECIEFIYDHENYEDNPLKTEKGLREIKELSALTGVRVFSICADFFMRHPLFDKKGNRDKNIETLTHLIKNSSTIGITDINVPCVDESSLKKEEDIEALKEGLHECMAATYECNTNINLETDLPPDEFNKLITDLNHPRIKVNYDIGNSASLGYNPEEELNAYGKYISVLHVKDRLYKGGSVKLGTGDADFETVFRKLKQIGFNGMIIMQAARADNDSEELQIVKEQFSFLKDCLAKFFYNGLES